jgi:polar amino acid transport system substrate-binding protein
MRRNLDAHPYLGRVALAFVAAWINSAPCLAQEAKLSLVTGALPPFSSVPGQPPGFLEALARAAFKRIDVDVEVSTVPVARALINVNDGLDDGDLFRIEGAEQTYPNIVRVPEKLFDSDFMAYTNRADIAIHGWADLQPYAVAYTTGWRIFDINVKDAKEIAKVSSMEALYPLLMQGRAEVILADRFQWQWAMRQNGYTAPLTGWPLARVGIYMYLNKSKLPLVPKVAHAIADMKADGTYQALYDKHLNPQDAR